MAKADTSSAVKTPVPWGFTPVPHSFRKLVATSRVSGLVQLHILFAVLDETEGKRGLVKTVPEWAVLKSAELAKECDAERRTVDAAIKDLVEREMLARVPAGPGKWKYKALVPNWDTATPYVAKKIEDTPAIDDDAAAPETLAAPIPQARFVVRPGRAAKPVLLAHEIRKVQYHARNADGFVFETALVDDVLHCSIFDVAIAKTLAFNGVEKSDAGAKKERTVEKCTSKSPKLTPFESVNASPQAPLFALLSKHLIPVLGKPPSAAICTAAAAALGAAPLPYLERLLVEKLRKRARSIWSYGLVPTLAADARAAFEHETAAAVPDATGQCPHCLKPIDHGEACATCSAAIEREQRAAQGAIQ